MNDILNCLKKEKLARFPELYHLISLFHWQYTKKDLNEDLDKLLESKKIKKVYLMVNDEVHSVYYALVDTNANITY